MYKLILLAVVVALAGCTSFTTKVTNADGSKCEASYGSVLQSKLNAAGSACGANGESSRTQSDQLAEALSGLLIRGIQAK